MMKNYKNFRRGLSVSLALALCAGMALPAFAVDYDIDIGNVYIESDGSWQENNDTWREDNKSTDDEINITQSGEEATDHNITVGEDVEDVTITIEDVNIDTSETGESAIEIGKDSDVTIELDGDNTLTSGYGQAGISVGENGSVTIQDKEGEEGSLTATGGEWAAGIGGGLYDKAGDVIIDSGTVEANGGAYGSGIGSGGYTGSSVGDVTINGGDVTANGGDYGAGIGSGYNGASAGDVTINGGDVTATGGTGGAGIGTGGWGSVESVTVSGGDVTATGGEYGAGIGAGYVGKANEVTISDGDVTATGGHQGAAIGAGSYGKVNSLKIGAKSEIHATAGEGSSCIVGFGLNGWVYSYESEQMSKNVHEFLELVAQISEYVEKYEDNPADMTVEEAAELRSLTVLLAGYPLQAAMEEDFGNYILDVVQEAIEVRSTALQMCDDWKAENGDKVSAPEPATEREFIVYYHEILKDNANQSATVSGMPATITKTAQADKSVDLEIKKTLKISEEIPVREGYTFRCWSWQGNEYQPGAEITLDVSRNGTFTYEAYKNVRQTTAHLYAIWDVAPARDPVDPDPVDPVDPDPVDPDPVDPVDPDPVDPYVPDDDDDDDDTPVVIPEEDVPLVETPDVEIPEEDVPLVETPDVEIPEEDVPLAEAPDVEIPDEEAPLANVPQTGEASTAIWLLAVVLAGAGLVAVNTGKRKEK